MALYFPRKRKKGTHSGGVAKFALLTPEASSIVHTHQNPIPLLPALPKITLLEIKRLLGKSIPIRKVMHGIDNVKRVCLGCVDVGCRGGVLRVCVYPVEV